MVWKTLDKMELNGKVALVRVDLNVPVEDGRVTDMTRIERIVPTLQAILAAGGKPVLMAHFGRPKGEVVESMSLRQVVPALTEALGREVHFATDCIGLPAKRVVGALEKGGVALLENTRFHAGEEANDAQFAAGLAALGDVYVNDAFSASHRAHASTERIALLLPSCAGRAMEAELGALERALEHPAKPVAAVVGGAKISTKLSLLSNLRRKVDHLVVGGAMANTFLMAQGHEIGHSLVEPDMVDTAREIMENARAAGCAVILPEDVVVAREMREGAESETVPADACPADAMILDAGAASVARLATLFESCRTLVWNGPLGAFETPPFDTATVEAAQKAAALTDAGRLVTVAGGGDTVAALNRAGVVGRFTYVSTAGGAFLEWLEGRAMPGVAALG